MKKAMMVALMALTATLGVFAQDGPGRHGGDRGERTPLTAAEMVDRRVARLTQVLTLDAAQQAQAKTIFTDEQTAATALRDKIEAAHEALQAAVKGSASDSQIDQLAAAVGTLNGQSLAVHSKAQAKLRAILNSAQKEKLDNARGRRGMGGGGMAPMRGRM